MDEFNTTEAARLRPQLLRLTAAPDWADALLAGRPYADLDDLLQASDRIIIGLPEAQVDAALAGHPRIGEKAADLDEESAARSAREQAGMARADASVQEAMARGNARYEERFGRIYLVAAAGRSAEDLLGYLEQRLGNDPAVELDVVRRELARITRLRLTDMLADMLASEATPSGPTTPTARGEAS
jgi:2-oxo-4-hydroxy-4-carboxy-5-ureidoimidazoline decarboxylase